MPSALERPCERLAHAWRIPAPCLDACLPHAPEGWLFAGASRLDIDKSKEGRLGRGGCGAVFRGKLDGKDVAIKSCLQTRHKDVRLILIR